MFNIDSFGNIYFTGAIAANSYPTITTTPTHVLVAGAGGIISRVAVSQLVSNTQSLSPVTSVFGRTGDIMPKRDDYNSSLIKEGTNLYFTNSRARAAISLTALGSTGPATYNPVTGVINVPQYQSDLNGVSSFNSRTGAVVLTALDVTTALTYTPLAVETDPVWTAQKILYYTKVETESYVTTQISNLVDSAPTALNTLNELAAALGDDANFSTTVTNLIGTKEPIITPGTTSQYWRGDKTWQTLPIYTLPIASASVLGGIKVGANLSIDGSGVLSAGNSYVLPTATSTILGGVIIGSGITITSGVISVSTNYEPPIAAGTISQYWRGDKTWQTLPVYTLSGLGGQPQLNGTGFVKASGTSISYDNSTYYLASNPSGYITSASIGNGTLTLNVSGNGLSGSTSFTANQSGSTTFTVTSNASTSATANTLVYRDSGADIYTRYFFGNYINTSDNDESGITRFIIKNGDSYHRSATTTVAADIIRGVASGTWSIAITGNAGSITNQANSATITASTGVNGNHIVQRDANGYIYANHINFNTSESENPSISSFITSNGDGWSRKSSIAHVRNQLGNYGGWITGISSTMVINALGYTPYNSTNPSGYITGYTETDTLASVTGRGASTSTALTFNGGINVPATIFSSFDNSWALRINRSNTSTYLGITYATGGNLEWYLGPREDATNTFRFYNFNTTLNAWSIDVSGNCTAYADIIAYSDSRVKKDISPITTALDKTLLLKGVSYKRIDIEQNVTKIGFIAQDVKEVLPEVVTYDEGADRYGVSYGNITALLVEAIKEQQLQIEDLKNYIKEINNKISKLEN